MSIVYDTGQGMSYVISAIEAFEKHHKHLLIFAIAYFTLQAMPYIASYTFFSFSNHFLLMVGGLSILPLFIYQMVLSPGPGGVIYYAYLINMLVYTLLTNNFSTAIHDYLQVLLICTLNGYLIPVFVAFEYILFKMTLRGRVGYRKLLMYWYLGPIMYLAILSLELPRLIISIIQTPSYRIPSQLGIIPLILYYAVPGPFIALATLPKILSKIRNIEKHE